MEDLLEFLRRSGASEAEIARAESEGWLPLLAVDRLLVSGPPEYDVAALTRAAGIDEELGRRLWRALGFPDVPGGVPLFTERDLAALRLAVARVTPPTDPEAFLRQVRVISAAMARIGAMDADLIAEALRELRAQGLSEREVAATLVEGIDWDGLSALFDHVHRLHARAAVWRRLTRDAFADLVVGVGFADIAGYTALSARLDPDTLSAMLGRWEELTYDCAAQHAGRVVKTIGDEVMFVGLAPAVVRIGLAIRAATTGDPLVPPVRVGLASGAVLARDGDFYGPVVNLASRLTEIAPPGSVLASAALHDQLASEPGLRWESLGRKLVRDIGEVEVFAVRATDQ